MTEQEFEMETKRIAGAIVCGINHVGLYASVGWLCGGVIANCGCEILRSKVMEALNLQRDDWKEQMGLA